MRPALPALPPMSASWRAALARATAARLAREAAAAASQATGGGPSEGSSPAGAARGAPPLTEAAHAASHGPGLGEEVMAEEAHADGDDKRGRDDDTPPKMAMAEAAGTDPLASAARAAAAPSLEAVPLLGCVTPEALSEAKGSLLKGISDALVAWIDLHAILATAAAAHAGYVAAKEEAHAARAAALAAAASHNDGTAGAGDEEYEGPRLIPLHTSVLTYLINRLHDGRVGLNKGILRPGKKGEGVRGRKGRV